VCGGPDDSRAGLRRRNDGGGFHAGFGRRFRTDHLTSQMSRIVRRWAATVLASQARKLSTFSLLELVIEQLIE